MRGLKKKKKIFLVGMVFCSLSFHHRYLHTRYPTDDGLQQKVEVRGSKPLLDLEGK
jgi:hypothetical protein